MSMKLNSDSFFFRKNYNFELLSNTKYLFFLRLINNKTCFICEIWNWNLETALRGYLSKLWQKGVSFRMYLKKDVVYIATPFQKNAVPARR